MNTSMNEMTIANWDIRSKTFLFIILAMFAIAALAFVEDWLPIAILFALFGLGGLLMRYSAKKTA